ncbi:glycosyltransferase family 2 protein [Flavimarina sp. Hel_I_48]|uniref:glycosyltransferase family 2 protein n=1 Tax=Flavimarina sp. Hel_I_48 TaxID=1392488 RepID=UPI00068DA0AE|nr:glycosyltransferase family A protein [Flavimarina sp. Hel_I_48]
MPEISVVVPIFNKAAYLKQTIQSVLNQTFSDFEILAVNDGSTDGSLHILKDFQDARLRIIDQENSGLSSARNVGIREATGEVIALLDADDLWKPQHLNNLIFLSQHFTEAHLYGTGYEEYFPKGKVVKPNINRPKQTEKPHIITDFFEANIQQPLVVPSSFAFRKVIVNEIGGFDPKISYSEDVDFYIRANLKYRFAYQPEITCRYIMESVNQITRSRKSDRIIPEFQRYLDENPSHLSLKQYINLKRYFLAIFYKIENRPDLFREMRATIDTSLLNTKQRQLLNAPKFVVIVLRFVKGLILKSGKRITSFD